MELKLRGITYGVVTVSKDDSGRISEINDSDIKGYLLHLAEKKQSATGIKDRYTMLAEKPLEILRQYWRECKPEIRGISEPVRIQTSYGNCSE